MQNNQLLSEVLKKNFELAEKTLLQSFAFSKNESDLIALEKIRRDYEIRKKNPDRFNYLRAIVQLLYEDETEDR